MAKGGKGRKGGGGGKTRKYSRDNNGRFASTGTGATARGGRLLTAKGNKRTARALAGKTKTIESASQKGVLAKPKGLKPGSIKPKAAAATKPVAKQIGAKVKDMGGDRKTMAAAAKPKGVITKAKSKPVASVKPKTQKERWAARAKMLNNAADKNDAKAKRLRDANDTTGNTAFNTQPGKIPGRARMNAASERSFRMNEKAQQQRTRAENLQRMATTNKGDAAKGYAARAEQVKASYGGIKKGTIVESIMGPGGAATVIRANAKSVTMKMSDGRIMNEPYERLKLKSPTLGSSKVVDGAKVNRMAARLGAKSRAPKSSSSIKNANTVAVRAKAVSFLKGKGGTFPNAAAASASMAANIRNRPVFSTGKKAVKPSAAKVTKASKGKMRATKRDPFAPNSTQAGRIAGLKGDREVFKQVLSKQQDRAKNATSKTDKIYAQSGANDTKRDITGRTNSITRIEARPIPGKRVVGRGGDGPVKGPRAKRLNTIKGKPKRDAGVAARVKPGTDLNAKKYPAIYRDRANTKGKAAAKAAKRTMR
jgi:hypothetical protein